MQTSPDRIASLDRSGVPRQFRHGAGAASGRDSRLFRTLIEEALTAGTAVRFSAEGTSMHPTIRHGDVITISPVSAHDVVRGDVLLCRHNKRMLAHRLVAVTSHGAERFFHLRGDGKAGCDAPVGADAVIGRVIAVRRNGRATPLGGRAARLRHRAWRSASSAKAWVMSGMIRLLNRGAR